MKGFVLSLGAVAGLALGAGLAQAGPTCGCYYPPIPQAPDMCGPGFYWANNCGMVYGPAYCPYPCYPPFQGMVPGPPGPRGGPGGPGGPAGPGGPGGPLNSPTFPTHPYARSPRDFFMYYDKDEPSYAPVSYGPVGSSVYSPLPYYSAPAVPAVPAVPPAPPAPQPPEEKIR